MSSKTTGLLETAASIRERLAEIEREVASNSYSVGGWTRLTREIRALPDSVREALAPDVSRVSNELHARSHPRRFPLHYALLGEGLATATGGVLLGFGLSHDHPIAVVAAALIWAATFQPLLKMTVGNVLGILHSHAYLEFGIEPRFKMLYGTYLAAPRWARVIFHFSGMFGSPIGAYAVWCAADASSIAPWVTYILAITFWLTLLNIVLFPLRMMGVRRLGSFRVATSSGGAAAEEILSPVG